MFNNSSREFKIDSPHFVKTKYALIFHKLLSEPLALIFPLVGVILYKNLSATPFQVAILTMAKPSIAILVLYWSSAIHSRSDRLVTNVVWAGVLSRIPFFFFPWIHNPWIFIACVAIYIFFYRAENPAWVEIMKLNLPNPHRGRIYSFALSFAYAEGVLLSLWIGPWMNNNESAWRWLFPITALIGLAATFFQRRIPLKLQPSLPSTPRIISIKSVIIKPWKDAYQIMSRRLDFLRFQVGFMLCGFGLMMLIPILPIFFVDVLKISYKELAIAFLVCKGLGFVAFSKFWGQKLNSIHIYRFTTYVHICFILFGILVFLSMINIYYLYVAYFIYGVAQAGSRLCWNLSGPIFSKEENSASYTSINILMVGVRGCIAPLFGSFCFKLFGVYFVITAFILLSLSAAMVMFQNSTNSKDLFLRILKALKKEKFSNN